MQPIVRQLLVQMFILFKMTVKLYNLLLSHHFLRTIFSTQLRQKCRQSQSCGKDLYLVPRQTVTGTAVPLSLIPLHCQLYQQGLLWRLSFSGLSSSTKYSTGVEASRHSAFMVSKQYQQRKHCSSIVENLGLTFDQNWMSNLLEQLLEETQENEDKGNFTGIQLINIFITYSQHL